MHIGNPLTQRHHLPVCTEQQQPLWILNLNGLIVPPTPICSKAASEPLSSKLWSPCRFFFFSLSPSLPSKPIRICLPLKSHCEAARDDKFKIHYESGRQPLYSLKHRCMQTTYCYLVALKARAHCSLLVHISQVSSNAASAEHLSRNTWGLTLTIKDALLFSAALILDLNTFSFIFSCWMKLQLVSFNPQMN